MNEYMYEAGKLPGHTHLTASSRYRRVAAARIALVAGSVSELGVEVSVMNWYIGRYIRVYMIQTKRLRQKNILETRRTWQSEQTFQPARELLHRAIDRPICKIYAKGASRPTAVNPFFTAGRVMILLYQEVR
jgi:hypothetical protein